MEIDPKTESPAANKSLTGGSWQLNAANAAIIIGNAGTTGTVEVDAVAIGF